MADKIVDHSQLTEEEKEQVKRNKSYGKQRGVGNKPLLEAQPTVQSSATARTINGDNGSFMVLGRDQPSHPFSGFGGKGATNAARVDLIAGVASSFQRPDGTRGTPGRKTVVNPNFASDAGRIYISQKADIDRYMGIAPVPGESSAGVSAVGIKADAIRLHSRQDIKIVTGRSRVENVGSSGEPLSGGGKNEIVGTISFIAGNYTDDAPSRDFNMLSGGKSSGSQKKLQPIIKGDNLVECLTEMAQLIGELHSLLKANGFTIDQINTGCIGAMSMAGPVPTTPSPTFAPFGILNTIQSVVSKCSQQTFDRRVDMIIENYLCAPAGKPEAPKSIRSKFVFTT